MIETLLLNFLFLLFPVLIFLIFLENRLQKFNTYILIILSAVTMLLCMAFPIKLEIGYIIDLRYIPFIIIALYGGYKRALILYAVLNTYRFFIGGEGVYHSFIFSTVIFSLVPLLSPWFNRLGARSRIICASLISLSTMVLYFSSLSFYYQVLNIEFWTLAIYGLTTHLLVMAIIMLLIEQILANMKAREKYLNSERLNLISELSASVSHEIRNPLTVTSGFLQLLNQSVTITQEEKKYIEYSLQELKRAETIVSDFLAFAKPQSENMIFSNLEAEMEYTKNIIIPYANMHQVEVEYSFNNSLYIHYDKNQLQQCLINLYKNGIEAMKENGGMLFINVYEANKSIIIKIRDTGIGMDKEEISRLGRPYYSTKTEGTGLGMLMVYSTVHKLKGTIEVESEKRKGTVFTIFLPV
ncbi:sensor histidine kinase [Peribacillus deserti]|uniref:histidine kinase n=1 Tax=Peribacillus deserti TaxID=673318 RepID=A0A2N5M3W6_9BACI|nr:HAMP domain-containing sensor histidine kinase [Peribacillus deserti]PLT29056.1 two-component sensor histidine kinase [Peribacillus deserti]